MRYARSDVMSVAIPRSAGGCGAIHSRPVTNGKPAEEWLLDCPHCSAYLRNDPLWAAMPADIPETPDEKTIREDAEKRGERALKKEQEKINLQLAQTTMQIAELLQKQNAPASQDAIAELVAREVARLMNQSAAPAELQAAAPQPDEPEADMSRLHVRTLAKMCRDRDIDDKGTKDELIARLTA